MKQNRITTFSWTSILKRLFKNFNNQGINHPVRQNYIEFIVYSSGTIKKGLTFIFQYDFETD